MIRREEEKDRQEWMRLRRAEQEERDQRAEEWLAMLQTEDGQSALAHFLAQIKMGSCRKTRYQVVDASVGCIGWQLLYAGLLSLPFSPAVLFSPWSYDTTHSKEYDMMVSILKNYMDTMKLFPRTAIYQISHGVKAILCEEESEAERAYRERRREPRPPCIREIDATFVDQAEDGRYYACTYDTRGVIQHYFILIRREGAWYLSSMYVSDWINSPVRTRPLPVEDLRGMLVAIHNIHEPAQRQYFQKWFTHYFLEGGKRIFYSEYSYEADASLKRKYIPMNMGVEKELEVVMSRVSDLRVGVMEHFEENVARAVKESYTLFMERVKQQEQEQDAEMAMGGGGYKKTRLTRRGGTRRKGGKGGKGGKGRIRTYRRKRERRGSGRMRR